VGLPSNLLNTLPSEPSAGPVNPFETALAAPSPFDAPPATVPMPLMASPMTENATTAPMAPPLTLPLPKDIMLLDDCTHEDAAPSRQDLLQRAAELGPARLTWENIVLAPTDPILGEKMQPRVAERRARFRKVVKVALGTCLAFCVVATAATALSSGPPKASASSSVSKTHVAATRSAVVPVEKLDQVTRTKAPSHVTAAIRPAAVVKKRR
jgi:hypothetical protein